MTGDITVSREAIDGYGNHRDIIDGVIDAFEAFFREFEARESLSQDDCERVLRGEELSGRDLRQRPEAFARQYLVHPLLDVFDHRYRIEPYLVEEEVGLDEISSNPDFRITGISYRNRRLGQYVEPMIFGEAKAINRYERAKKNIYDPENEAKGYLRLDIPVEVGIATDGFSWGIFLYVPRSSFANPNEKRRWAGEVSLNEFAAYAANQFFNGT